MSNQPNQIAEAKNKSIVRTCSNCIFVIRKQTTEDNTRIYCKLTKDVRSRTGHSRIKLKQACILSDEAYRFESAAIGLKDLLARHYKEIISEVENLLKR